MVVFEKTPFYPEGGGQISDVGKASNNSSVLEVKNVQKVKNTIIHHAVLKKGTVSIRDEYELEIDAARRGKITVNHSATHLLNQALTVLVKIRNQDRSRCRFSHISYVTKIAIFK